MTSAKDLFFSDSTSRPQEPSLSSADRSQPHESQRPIKAALDPITDTAPSSFAVLGHAVKGIGSGWNAGSNGGDVLHEMAPMIFNPRFIANASNHPVNRQTLAPPSRTSIMTPLKMTMPSLGPRQKTSASLSILEAIPSLLSAPLPEPSSSSTDSNTAVSLLRGFQATVPSSERGKERRRKVRGNLAEVGLGGGRLGVKRLAAQNSGLLGASGEENEDGEVEEGVMMTGKERRRRRREKAKLAASSSKGGSFAKHELGREELLRMEDEIKWDRENLVVRKSLINSEIEELSSKISALEKIRMELEQDILKLKEEDLGLQDELEGIQDRLLSITPEGNRSIADATGQHAGPSSRRRKGPAFLPSEHDDLPSGVAFMTLVNHTAPITALDFSEPYGVLVSAAADDSLRVWDLCSGEESGRLRGHRGTVKAIQCEDQLCFTGGVDGDIRLWDLRLVDDYEDKLARDMQNSSVIYASASNNVQEDGGEASKEETSVGNPCIRTLEGHSKAVSCLYYESGCLVTGSSDKTIRQWDVNTGQCVLTMDILWAISSAPPPQPAPTSFDPYGPLTSESILPGSNLLASVTSGAFAVPTPPYSDGSWDMYQDFVGGVQFWGYALASASGDGGVRMWDMRTGQAHRTLLGHTGPVTCLQFDEMNIVTGSLDKTIRIWDLRMGAVSEVLKHEFPVTSVQFDSRKIISCTGENGIDVYNRTSHQHSRLTTNGHTLPAERLRYEDKYMVSGGKDATVKVWSL
ncbi:FOG: WD40 repeat [Phaffia rhodozyma]|uniref:FOG: WD40 repeat n=1 Tax=Phaffia rhodozyma TaxID=264483 RepID=A0A0F7STE2_PHARH|nr:FOG: WD40 repeat [Phaffia rhodozyma]